MTTERNKEIVRRMYEATDRHDVDALEEFFSPDLVDHNPPPIPGLAPGVAGIRQAFQMFLDAHPDGTHTIEDMMGEGDRVVVRVTGSGTHTGELMGVAPTGKRLTMTGIAIYRLADGKIVERWAEHDLLGLLQQLGLIPTKA